MEKMNIRLQRQVDLLIKRYPILESVEQNIIDAYLVMQESYENGGKLLIAGNGGSAADSEHSNSFGWTHGTFYSLYE